MRSNSKTGATIFIFRLFLVADTQLYKRLCPSVGPSARVEKWENKRLRTFLVADNCISAPAHLSATGGRVSGLVWFRIDGQADKTNKRTEVVVFLRQRESHRNGEP